MNTEARAAHETTLDPNRATHVGIWRDEHDDLTREFYTWDVPDLPESVRRAMAAGLRHDLVGMNLDNITDLLEPGYLPLETGMASCPNGEICVAIWTSWPGTTPEMIDWWVGWHIARTERYKLWHPQAQVVTGQSWPGGVAVDLFLNGVYVATSITDWNAEGSASPFFDLAALGVTVVAGDEVTLALSDGSRTETHIVTGVSLTLVDIAADTVAGTAEPGSLVFVGTVAWLSDSPQANLLVTTNEAGEWLADFSSMVDLVPATVGQAGQWDNSGNFTTLLWAPELTSKDQCKKGGWQDFGFKNQGQCVSSIARQT